VFCIDIISQTPSHIPYYPHLPLFHTAQYLSLTGIRAIDLGMPQLSMHSIRETMGIADLTFAHKLFKEFFKQFSDVDAYVRVDSDHQ
jgi:hypothetical protein